MMSVFYEEIIRGEALRRSPPGSRHELICSRLHSCVGASLDPGGPSRLLPPRSIVSISPGVLLRPDLALVAAATGKTWLAAEIVNSQDHRIDTVTKKGIYEETGLPRLWMIDPRYDNVEVYHSHPYGLVLHQILAGKQVLTETLLPGFQIEIEALFAP
jgi:Uma2 family endonuclease